MRTHDDEDCREIVDELDWAWGHHQLIEMWEIPGTTVSRACVICGRNVVHSRGPQMLKREDGTVIQDAEGKAVTVEGMAIYLTCRGTVPLCRSDDCISAHATPRVAPAAVVPPRRKGRAAA